MAASSPSIIIRLRHYKYIAYIVFDCSSIAYQGISIIYYRAILLIYCNAVSVSSAPYIIHIDNINMIQHIFLVIIFQSPYDHGFKS